MISPCRRQVLILGPILLAAILHASESRAEIEQRRKDGQIVFTSRPDRKPGVTSSGPRSASGQTPRSLQRLIEEVSDRYRMDPGLVRALINVESGFDPAAVSPKGARGLMQLMPATAREYGVRDVHDPRQNVEGGVAYLADLTKRYDGNLKLALAAYNAGPTAVGKAGGVPGYPETIEYIERIEAQYGKSLTGVLVAPPAGKGGSIRASVDENGHIFVTNRPHRHPRPGTSRR